MHPGVMYVRLKLVSKEMRLTLKEMVMLLLQLAYALFIMFTMFLYLIPERIDK